MSTAHPSQTWQGSMLGRYHILYLLGRGGMGEVWLAADTQLHRQVAVKLLPAVLTQHANALKDFEREARAIAALEHPHILPIHDFGKQSISENEIITYLIMPYITGGTLRDCIQTRYGPLPKDEALHYLRESAQAIDYAHSQRVLHRDIKPANMLLQQGWLLLADFGIAKLLTTSTQNQTHAGAGTPAYMAPEQAQGRAEFASDRYSLAVVAYQLFTGVLPFQGDTPYAILLKQLSEPPPAPRQFNPTLPPAVEQAILWGMAKRPADRPALCMTFVDAIERGWQTGTPHQVDQEITLLAPWSKRRIENADTLSPAGDPLPQQLTDQANIPLPKLPQWGEQPLIPGHPHPQEPSSLTTTPLPASKMSRRALLIGGGLGLAALVAAGGIGANIYWRNTRHQPAQATPPGPHKLIAGIPCYMLTGHQDAVAGAKWHPSGRYLATLSQDTYLKLWDLGGAFAKHSPSIQTLSTSLHSWKISNNSFFYTENHYFDWSSDGRTLAVSTFDTYILVFDAFSTSNTPQKYADINPANPITSHLYEDVSWLPGTNTFATYDSDFSTNPLQFELWRVNMYDSPLRTLSYSGQGEKTLVPHDTLRLDYLASSKDGKHIAAHTSFSKVIIWDATTGSITNVLRLSDHELHTSKGTINYHASMGWSPTDPHILATSVIDTITVWDVAQNKLLMTLELDEPAFSKDSFYPFPWGLCWSPNGKYVAACFPKSPRVYIWNVQTNGQPDAPGTTRKQMLLFPQHSAKQGHTEAVNDVAWSPDGRYIATSSADKTVILWKVDAS